MELQDKEKMLLTIQMAMFVQKIQNGTATSEDYKELRDELDKMYPPTEMEVRFKKLSPTAQIPTRAHPSDAGMDLYVDKREYEEIVDEFQVDPLGTGLRDATYERVYTRYKSNVALEIPKGYVGLLFPRSSVYKVGGVMTNCVGVIDSNYRGSVDAVFRDERGDNEDSYEVGDRFAQLIIMPYPQIKLVEADELSSSDRGEGGYGSTGK